MAGRDARGSAKQDPQDAARTAADLDGPATVLVVEDDAASRLMVCRFLEGEGHCPVEAADGPAGLAALAAEAPAVVVMDLGLPGLDGVEVLRRIRRTHGVPVIVVTGRDDEAHLLEAFQAGADDYVVKPVSLAELGARVQALLRRGSPVPPTDRFEVGPLVVDLGQAVATLDGRDLDLTPKELALLAASPDRCFPREELLHHVWGSTAEWQQLDTVRGQGYKLARADLTPS